MGQTFIDASRRLENDAEDLGYQGRSARHSGVALRVRSSIQVNVFEERAGVATQSLYRDAVRLRQDRVLLVMFETVDHDALEPLTIARTRALVRSAGKFSTGPGEILADINQKLCHARRAAVGMCALLRPSERLIDTASAGAPAPWIARQDGRVLRPQLPPSVELGAMRGARYEERALHFGVADTLLLTSQSWTVRLEHEDFGAIAETSPLTWLRALRDKPSQGCMLCLSAA
jgi:hypothetical protein